MPAPYRITRPAPWWQFGLSEVSVQARNYAVTVATVGVLLFGACLTLTIVDESNLAQPFLIVFGLCVAVAFSPAISIRHGTLHVHYRFYEYPVIIGLVLAPPYVVVVAYLIARLGQLVVAAAPRREHWWRIPTFFGFSAVGMTIYAFIGTTAAPWTYMAGAVINSVVFDALLYGYQRAKHDPAAWHTFTNDWAKRLVAPLVVSGLAAAMITLFGAQKYLLLLSPVLMLFAYWWLKAQQARTADQTAWKRMEQISSQFIGEMDETSVIKIALSESLHLFAASKVEIILHESIGGSGACYSMEMGPVLTMQFQPLPDLDSGDPRALEPLIVESPTCRRISLRAGDREIGAMAVHWTDPSSARSERMNMAQTLAHSVAASISNSRSNQQISKQASEKAREAQHDPLTALGNRSMLFERGPAILEEQADIGGFAALLLLDLDGFKAINDTLGHSAGDEVLQQVAERIRSNVREYDLSIRLGGDEFAVLVQDMTNEGDALLAAGKIARALTPPIKVEDIRVTVEASIGIAVPEQHEDIRDLLKMADIAMYEAKKRGRGQIIRYTPGMDTNTTEALLLATDLRRAIQSNELVLYYQPQVSLATGEIVGMEALVRWNHPELGLLSPDRFVPLAETSGLVRQFTLAIIHKALEDRIRFRELLPDATVSVNLSGRNLLDQGLAMDIRRGLSRTGVKPHELVLEITETATAGDYDAAEKVLSNLHRMGCKIAMDDFGTGYATLEAGSSGASMLHEIKIDRGFIKDIHENKRDAVIAEALVRIGHAWECRVVAEGVEDEFAFDLLRQMDCDIAQGYFIHRPAPAETILDWVRDRLATTATPTPPASGIEAPDGPDGSDGRPSAADAVETDQPVVR